MGPGRPKANNFNGKRSVIFEHGDHVTLENEAEYYYALAHKVLGDVEQEKKRERELERYVLVLVSA